MTECSISNAIRARRAALRWTQANLAAKLGWSRSRVLSIEQDAGKLPIRDLQHLCDVLDLDVSALAKMGG